MTFQLKTSTTVGAEAADDELLGATSQRVTFGAVTINADASRYVRVRLSATASSSSEGNAGSGYLFIAGPFAGIYKFTNGGAPTQISGAFSPALSMNSGSFAVQSGSCTFDQDSGGLTLAITIAGTTHTATANDATSLSGTFANVTNYVPTATDFSYYEWIEAPGAPTAPTETNVTDVSATLSCTAPTSGGAVVSYEVDVREFGTTPWTTFSSAGPSRSVTIFETATRYQYRWRALGSGATVSPDSAIADFWTANAVTGGGQIVPVLLINTAGLPASVTVTDEDALPVQGASVVANPGAIALGLSDAQGVVSTAGLAAGNYTLTATKASGVGSASIRLEGGPVITSPATFQFDGSALAVGAVVAVDPNSDTVAYSIVGGADAGLFAVGASSGVMSFQVMPTTNRSYAVVVRASDGALYSDRSIVVIVLIDPVIVGNLKASQLQGLSNNIRWVSAAKGLMDKQPGESLWVVIDANARRIRQGDAVSANPTVSQALAGGAASTLTIADLFHHNGYVGFRVSAGALTSKHDVTVSYTSASGQTLIDRIEIAGAVA